MKIALAYRAIDGIAGGAERMSNAIMNEMCARGHEVHFYTIDQDSAQSYYEMDKRITWHKLNMGDYRQKAGWGLRIKRALKARKIFKTIKPDVILAFQDGAFVSTRFYTAFTNIPVILAERVSPQHYSYKPSGRSKGILEQIYRLACKITIQCDSYKPLYPQHLRRKLLTIPNPVFPAQNHAKPQGTPKDSKTLLCVGRLGYQKNQHILVEAFMDIADDFPDWSLALAGDGEDMGAIKIRANHHPQIQLLGNVKEISNLYARAHLFCLPSRWEGFPNALAEALAHGLPAVGFSACGGVCDLIEHGQTGLLAEGSENKDTLREALRSLMQDDERRKVMGKAAIESMKQYEPQKIFDAWENLFKTVIQR